MENNQREKELDRANTPTNYTTMLLGAFLAVTGTFIRFLNGSHEPGGMWAIIGWALLLVGAIIAIKGVFKVLGTQKYESLSDQ